MSNLNNALYRELHPDTMQHFGITDEYKSEHTYKLVKNKYPFLSLKGISPETHSKLNEVRKGKDFESNIQVSSVKKMYALRGCTYTKKRIKELAAFNNIKIVNDIYKADTVLVADKVNTNKDLSSKTLWYNSFRRADSHQNITSNYNYFSNTGVYNTSTEYSPKLASYLYLNILELIDSSGLKVLTESDLLCQSANLIPATKEVIDDIVLQFKNKDTRTLAASLAVNLDFASVEYLKYYFIKKIKYDLYGTGKLFDFHNYLRDEGISRYESMSAMESIIYMHKNNLLDKVGFKYLEDIARQGIYILKADIYKFDVSFKKEYKKYL